MERLLEVAFRLFGGAILLFAAFLPAWILFHLAKTLLLDPGDLDLTAAIAFAICAPLLYFFLLLAFRAFTGRGRRQDGGLLPPLALKFVALFFGAIGIAIAIFGFFQGEPRPVIGGLGYLASAFILHRVVRQREWRVSDQEQAVAADKNFMKKLDTVMIARNAIAEILAKYPDVETVEDADIPVELSVTVPLQSGVQHEIWLALQNGDELTLGVGHFQCEWFPCTNAERVDEFVQAVTGWLSGRFRILEHYRGSRCVEAQLQAPDGGDWRTLATWSMLWLPIPFTKTYRVITNE